MHTPADKKRISADEDAVGAMTFKGCERSINLVAIARVEDFDLHPERISSRVDIFHSSLGNLNISRIYEYPYPSGLWQQLTPPGRDRLETRPCLTGSSPTLKTIGIVLVVAFAASAAGKVNSVAMTLT